MKRLLLAGGGQAHALVLGELARRRLTGIDVIMITPSSRLLYSGMLPGWVAGHYALNELTVELAPLVQAAGAKLIRAQLQRLDLTNRVAYADSGDAIDFDVLSIATGAVIEVDSITGATEHALPLRPFDRFVIGWEQIMRNAQAAADGYCLTVIGAGAAGTEIALAAACRARTARLPMRIQMLTGGDPILPGHGHRARSLMHAALAKGNVQIVATTADRIEPDAVITRDVLHVATNATLLATGASAAAWLRHSQLALDDRGFIAVNSNLQSISHPFVFAAGDVATLIETPRPKSGVFAVRAAKPLAANLMAALTGAPLSTFSPQRRALYLLSTGPQRAIASWGGLAAAGRWLWRWKNRIDRDYIAKLNCSKN
ncbi:MAG TPA: FAD-dependent oxidoreductase [Burkholderiaceae bacterium]|nr:FAD-dependent oxidoreductase [Burkholderiaceae bacterium]